MVEHLKVQFTYWVGGLMVEPACASLTVEHLKVLSSPLWSSPLKGPLLISRAPAGPGQSSVLTHPHYIGLAISL